MSSPTLRTIAKAAGVSVCTVSRALRGHSRISPETRVLIRKMATDMGYRINPFVSSWMSHVRSTKTDAPFQGCLAMVDTHTSPKPLSFSVTPRRQIAGAMARAEELGFVVEMFPTYQEGFEPARLAKILLSRGILGVLFPVSADLPKFNFPCDKFACVALGRRMADFPFHFASSDQFTAMITCCEEMTRLGYRRLGVILPRATDTRVEGRFSFAFVGWQQILPPAQRLPVLFYDNIVDEEKLYRWCRDNRPDAIICMDELDRKSPETSPREVVAKHWRIPEDIGFATLDWHPKAGNLGWAGFNQMHELVGAAAIDLLVGQIHRNERGRFPTVHGVYFEGVWQPGASAPGPKSSL